MIPQNSSSVVSLTPNSAPSQIIAENRSLEKARLTRFDDLLGQWETEAQQLYEARQSGLARGPVTGLGKLDEGLGGFLAPGVHILHGQPGTGKSAFALQVAATCGVPALFVSCEMAALELLIRHTARVTGTYLGRLKSGEFSPTDSLSLVRRGAAAAPRLCLLDATIAPVRPDHLHDCALIARGEAAAFLVVIDSVQSWAEALGQGATEYETLNQALLYLRGLAHTLRCPVLAISERNRESMSGGGLSAGAGSRKIEYGAETVIDLMRDPNTLPDAHGEVLVNVKLVKNRHGSAGKSIPLHFNGALQRFSMAA